MIFLTLTCRGEFYTLTIQVNKILPRCVHLTQYMCIKKMKIFFYEESDTTGKYFNIVSKPGVKVFQVLNTTKFFKKKKPRSRAQKCIIINRSVYLMSSFFIAAVHM